MITLGYYETCTCTHPASKSCKACGFTWCNLCYPHLPERSPCEGSAEHATAQLHIIKTIWRAS